MIKLLFLLFFSASISCHCQTLRQVKGLKSLDIQGGIISDGYKIDLSYNYFVINQRFYSFNVNYFQGDNESTKFESIGLDNTFSINLLSIKKIIYVNIGAGLNLSYEFLNATKENRLKENISFGPVFSLENEIVLINDLSIFIKLEYCKKIRSIIYKDFDSIRFGFRYYI